MPFLLSSSTTLMTAFFAWASDLAPVHTIFPELKMSVAVLGFFRRYTSPGNCSGLYSTPGKSRTIELRSIFCFRVADATTFSMLMYDSCLARGRTRVMSKVHFMKEAYMNTICGAHNKVLNP
jgi:hypothetical protein